MKNVILLLLTLIISLTAFAQVAINTDGSAPDNSAMLDVKSTEQGFLPPRMTSAQRDAISSPAEGLCVYNTDSLSLEFWDGAAWFDICTGNSYAPPPIVQGGCATGAYWMDRNLGASQVATSSTDYLAYGSIFQWGRLADGHEIINWTSSTGSDGVEQTHETDILSSTDDPGHADFILASTLTYDWRSPQNDNLWQGASGINNPCPTGFRLPTETELDCERVSWSHNNAAGAFDSPLGLSVAGFRYISDGSFRSVGSGGFYWSSTVISTTSRCLLFYSSTAYTYSHYRVHGFSVRCIKD